LKILASLVGPENFARAIEDSAVECPVEGSPARADVISPCPAFAGYIEYYSDQRKGAAMAKKGRRVESGSARMKRLGHKPCQVWLDKVERSLVERASKMDRRPMATFIRLAAIDLAKVMLKEPLDRGTT